MVRLCSESHSSIVRGRLAGGVRKVDVVRMCVCATGDAFTNTFESVLGLEHNRRKVENHGGVAPVRSPEIYVRSGHSLGTGMVERVFRNNRAEIHIWEETGESIARHVWYAWSEVRPPSLTLTGTPASCYHPTSHLSPIPSTRHYPVYQY